MSLKSNVAKGLKWQVINIMGRQLVSFGVFATLSRLLDRHAFGLAGLVTVYLGFVGMFAEQGMGAALMQREELTKEHMDTAFWFNGACAGFLCLMTIVFAGPIARLFGEPQLAPLLSWASLGLIIWAASMIHATLFARELDFRRPALRMLVANVTGGVVGVMMALTGCGVWALVGQQLSGALAGAIFLIAVSNYRPSLRFSRKHLRDLFAVSSSVFGTQILWFLSSRVDQIIIGRFAGVAPLGLYVIAAKVPDLAKTVTHTPTAELSLPALCRLQNDHQRMRSVIYSGMQMNAMVSFAVFVGLASVASDLVPLLFGSQWAEAGALCSLLCLYALVNVLQVFFHPSLLASGGPGKYVLLNVWHAAGVLVAATVGIQFGTTWLVVGLIINGLIVSVPALLFLRQRIGLSPAKYLKPCLVPFLAALSMFAAIHFGSKALPFAPGTMPLLACKIATGAVVYSTLMLVFNRGAALKLLDTIRHALGRRPIPEPEATAMDASV